MGVEAKINFYLRHQDNKGHGCRDGDGDDNDRDGQISAAGRLFFHGNIFHVKFFLLKYQVPAAVSSRTMAIITSRGFCPAKTDFLCLSLSSMIKTISSASFVRAAVSVP